MNRRLKRTLLFAAAIVIVAALLVPAGIALAQQSATYRLGCFSMTTGSGYRQSASAKTVDRLAFVGVDSGGANSATYRIKPGVIQVTVEGVPPPPPGSVMPPPGPNDFKLPIIFRGAWTFSYLCN